MNPKTIQTTKNDVILPFLPTHTDAHTHGHSFITATSSSRVSEHNSDDP